MIATLNFFPGNPGSARVPAGSELKAALTHNTLRGASLDKMANDGLASRPLPARFFGRLLSFSNAVRKL